MNLVLGFEMLQLFSLLLPLFLYARLGIPRYPQLGLVGFDLPVRRADHNGRGQEHVDPGSNGHARHQPNVTAQDHAIHLPEVSAEVVVSVAPVQSEVIGQRNADRPVGKEHNRNHDFLPATALYDSVESRLDAIGKDVHRQKRNGRGRLFDNGPVFVLRHKEARQEGVGHCIEEQPQSPAENGGRQDADVPGNGSSKVVPRPQQVPDAGGSGNGKGRGAHETKAVDALVDGHGRKRHLGVGSEASAQENGHLGGPPLGNGNDSGNRQRQVVAKAPEGPNRNLELVAQRQASPAHGSASRLRQDPIPSGGVEDKVRDNVDAHDHLEANGRESAAQVPQTQTVTKQHIEGNMQHHSKRGRPCGDVRHADAVAPCGDSPLDGVDPERGHKDFQVGGGVFREFRRLPQPN
mmetsp:Transcript_31005/g.73054  ORF Transcript_31005/g.73054 Transcript_31005/m.73054 type:complete len:406 (+) Transcript_31005:239-1456(+)